MQFSARTRIAKNKHAVNIYPTPALSALFFSIIERSVLMALVFYHKYTLEKVKMQSKELSNFQLFLCYRKNPVKCSACVVSQKIAIE